MNGVMVVNKPKGCTSRDVVNQVGKILNTRKIGHTGTLDPMASGVLVLCVGSGLKLVELLMNHDKEYIAKVKLGILTDTLDVTGNIVRKDDFVCVSSDEVRKVLSGFIGTIKQEVPIYSSVKVHGKKLYEYARGHEEVILPIRDVTIYDLELLGDIKDNEFVIRCSVSKGTYIRSLIRDIGEALGTCATMIALERTRVDNFSLEDAYSIDDIKRGQFKILNPCDVLDLPKVVVDEKMEFKVKNGQVLDKFFDEDMAFIVNKSGDLLAIYQKKDDNFVKPYRMF